MKRGVWGVGVLALALMGTLWLAPAALGAGQPATRRVRVVARSFEFEPGVIRVNRGDRVIIDLYAEDVTHSLYVDGYGVRAEAWPGHTTRLEFVADRAGKFKFRCAVVCGVLHPFMIGELVVSPNQPYRLALALTATAALGTLGWLALRPRGSESTGAR